MFDDRKLITEGEIMMLIDFALVRFLSDNDMEKGGIEFPSHLKDDYKVKIELTKE